MTISNEGEKAMYLTVEDQAIQSRIKSIYIKIKSAAMNEHIIYISNLVYT
jgi:hypothetical protein